MAKERSSKPWFLQLLGSRGDGIMLFDFFTVLYRLLPIGEPANPTSTHVAQAILQVDRMKIPVKER